MATVESGAFDTCMLTVAVTVRFEWMELGVVVSDPMKSKEFSIPEVLDSECPL